MYLNPTPPAIVVTAGQISAGNVVLSATPKTLFSVLVTVATTAAQNINFVDAATSAAAGGANIIAIIPGGTAAGTNFPLLIVPCINGVAIQQNAALAAGQITVVLGN